MSDDADTTEVKTSLLLGTGIAEIQARARAIPAGEPGTCDFCGEWSGRLVNSACAPCRDKLKLP